MPENKKNILLIGAGKAGAALLQLFLEDDSVNVIGIVDVDQSAPAIKIAEENKIPTAGIWNEFIKDEQLNEIINATGSQDIHDELIKDKPEKVTLIDNYLAKTFWYLAKEYSVVEEKIKEAREEVEIHEWGVKKTNEAIKKLYAELEKKNEELKKLDQLKSDFLSTVSHELRTPLAITKEGISLILDGTLGQVSEKQAKVLTTAADSIDRLSRLINNLLDISKIEAGKEEMKTGLVSLTDIAHQIVSFFESKVGAKGIDIRANVAKGANEVYADGDKVIQVFTNIVNNAIKFTEEGYIEIGVQDKGNLYECYVQDTGKGVPEDEVANMFVKFQQIDRVHGDGEKGTGLGLSIVQGIIDMHNGEIHAESEVGKGTKVIFTLPKKPEREVLRDYIEKGIEDAENKETKMSLIIVGIEPIKNGKGDELTRNMSKIVRDIDGILRSNLDHSGSAPLKESGECIVVLPNSNKEKALSAEGRLKQAIDDYLTREKLTNNVKLRFGCATYPDEGSTEEELINVASKNNIEKGS